MIDYDRCEFPTKNGACNNQNLNQQYCYYHRKIVEGLLEPEKSTAVTLSSLPSYANMGDD